MTVFNRREHLLKIMKDRVSKLPPASVRFWKFVNKTETCWLWTGGTFESGYGAFQVNGKTVRAHRFSWELEHGPIPEGQDVLHTCDVPLCVRPHHHFLGTSIENVADRVAKGRSARGERVSTSKLREDQIAEIRQRLRDGETQRALGRAFGVSKSQIGNIGRGEHWAHREGGL